MLERTEVLEAAGLLQAGKMKWPERSWSRRSVLAPSQLIEQLASGPQPATA